MTTKTKIKAVPKRMPAKVVAALSEPTTILAVKGFDKDFACRGHKFEVGQTYTVGGKIVACENGFHACENPFDVWKYYRPIDSRFALVELSGELARHSEDSKIAAASITIKAELTLPQFIVKAVDWIIEVTVGKGDNPSGYAASIGSSGYAASIGSSGNDASIGSSGNDARIGSSGNDARIGSSGNDARIGSSGYAASIDSSGEVAVIASAGNLTQAKGELGTWVSLATFNDAGKCIGFATGCIGNDGLEPDIWYRADGCKLVRVK